MMMKFELNRLHLKWRIFLFLLGFCALLLIILWLFQTVFLDSFYRRVKVMEVKSSASTIEKNIDNSDLDTLIAGIAQEGDVSIDILNQNGNSLYQSYGRKNSQINHMPMPAKLDLIIRAQNQNGEYYGYQFENPEAFHGNNGFIGDMPPDRRRPEQSLIYVKTVQNAAGEHFAIILDTVISPVNATVATLQYQLYFITGMMILLSVILAFIIAKRVSKPIEEINQSAKILAGGNYDTQFNGKGFLEISELSSTLNTTAAELSKTESLRRELMANISHDLRTPLSLIYSYAEMMHDFPAEITPEQTQIIMDETRRLSTLVNDVLDISKLESGVQQTTVSEFNLTRNISTTTQRMAELVKKEGFQLTFLYDQEIFVRSDETKISQVFYNLLINAVNYTGKDRNVIIRQLVTGETVRIEVIDSGEGIPAEDLPYIWDRYYRTGKKHKRAITGTGLGLSIVKQVMKLLGGEYGTESQTGQGSVFWFSLRCIKLPPRGVSA